MLPAPIPRASTTPSVTPVFPIPPLHSPLLPYLSYRPRVPYLITLLAHLHPAPLPNSQLYPLHLHLAPQLLPYTLHPPTTAHLSLHRHPRTPYFIHPPPTHPSIPPTPSYLTLYPSAHPLPSPNTASPPPPPSPSPHAPHLIHALTSTPRPPQHLPQPYHAPLSTTSSPPAHSTLPLTVRPRTHLTPRTLYHHILTQAYTPPSAPLTPPIAPPSYHPPTANAPSRHTSIRPPLPSSPLNDCGMRSH
jgi:hypothetical protein